MRIAAHVIPAPAATQYTWNRTWKIRLIESMNPEWDDLFDECWGAIKEGPADLARRHIGRDRVDM